LIASTRDATSTIDNTTEIVDRVGGFVDVVGDRSTATTTPSSASGAVTRKPLGVSVHLGH
jgi:hypothetical protein